MFFFKEQEKRKTSIEKVCEKHNPELLYEEVPLFDFDYNWNYITFFPQYNFLYCGVPKAGTTTWIEGRISILTINFISILITSCFVTPNTKLRAFSKNVVDQKCSHLNKTKED